MSFKIIIIGDSCVGKTSLARRYVNNIYVESYKSTIGVDFLSKTIKMNKKTLNLQLWDTAGSERFRAMSPSFYRGADGCIVVFDLTNMLSFRNLENWIDEFLLISHPRDPDSYPFIIIGNKSDLINDSNRTITHKAIEKFCESKNIKYFEVSTKFNINISSSFDFLINKMYKKNSNETNVDLLYDMQSINLNEDNQDNEDMDNNYNKIKLNSKNDNNNSYCYCTII
jgi:Ras-related protein Rab-7A